MFSKIIINKENLNFNIDYIKEHIQDKKLCIMVKADAYGHGVDMIIPIIESRVDFFGVSNEQEAFKIRGLTSKGIIVFGACEDYKKCMRRNISFAVFSLNNVKKVVKIAKKYKLTPKMHLCINSGMNRYGVKTEEDVEEIIEFLIKENLFLEGIYTHFSSLTTDEKYTLEQNNKFQKICSLLPNYWKTIKHIGGGNSIYRNFDTNMNRVGMLCYGYGNDIVKPVLSIISHIVDIQKVAKGEHIGYLCGYTAKKDMKVATIPLGYADGLSRKYSNKIYVMINGQKVYNVGNICMDAFMVDVSKLDCKINDEVVVLSDAKEFAPLIESTEYEVLTNFRKFRGKRIFY